MKARRALGGLSLRLCLYVCMSVTGLRLKYTGLRIVYVPLQHVPLMMPSRWRSRTRRIPVEDYARTSPDVWRQLTAQQKDEKRQDNGDKKRLVRQHPSDLLCSLTRELDTDRRRTARRRLDSASSVAILFDRTFHVLRVRHMMRMHIPSNRAGAAGTSGALV